MAVFLGTNAWRPAGGLLGGRRVQPDNRGDLVERWFALLTEKQIKRGAHRSTRALEAAIRQYLAVTNQDPKPFVWTKTADEILANVARFCHRISGTGH